MKVPQIAIGAIDWTVQKPIYEGPTHRRLLDQLLERTRGYNFLRPTAFTGRRAINVHRRSSPEERRTQLTSFLVAQIAPILGIDAASIDPNRPMTDFGLDSLMALDVQKPH